VGAVTQVNRDVVAKTFKEVYCAQRLGKKSDEILAIYAANGFTTPKDWTEAWTRTGDDPAWQEELARSIRDSRCQ